MIDSEDDEQMRKERKTAKEIIDLLASVLTESPKSINRISTEASSDSEILKHSTVERYLEIIILIQELFPDCKVQLQKQEIGGRVYKEAWLEKS